MLRAARNNTALYRPPFCDPDMLRLSHRALYAAFDRVPSAKGAATHIARMAAGLFEHAGGGVLLVPGDNSAPLYQCEGRVEIARLHTRAVPLLERINAYQRFVYHHTRRQAATLRIAHFRDPWSGIPIVQALDDAGSTCRIVYEINGLPSLEWPERYRAVARSTIARLRDEEERCWQRAHAIIVPSATMAENLVPIGVPAARIKVIPNGADLPWPPVPPRPLASPYFLYFGALQPWQGVPVLLKAFARLADFDTLKLVICASAPVEDCAWLYELAALEGVSDRIVWQHELEQTALRPWIAHALASVAPLTQCPRNIDQGCCPLKILESMAHGVPVVASDLPVVREIIEPDVHGVLTAPDRPADLARALRLLLDYPERRMQLGHAAQQRIQSRFTWDHTLTALRTLYQRLDISPSEEHHDQQPHHARPVLHQTRPVQTV